MAVERSLCRKILPLGEGDWTVKFISLMIDKVTLSVEGVGYRMVDGCEFLQG